MNLHIGLLPRVIIAIILGVALGNVLSEGWVRVFVTFNGLFGQFLGFMIPLIIVGLVTPAIADIGRGAGRLLLLTVAIRASTVAGLLVCTILCNPLTYLPLYYLAWWTGDLLLPGRASWAVLRASFETMRAAPLAEALTVAAHMGVDAAVVLLVGGLVLALPLALCSYPAACRFFLMVERKRREKHRLDAAGGQAG